MVVSNRNSKLFCRLSIFRRALDAEMRTANEDGVANKTKKAETECITEEDEKILWDKNILGCHTAKSLVHTIYFYNGKLFGLRAVEHRNLRYANFRVESNCIIFDESVSKTFHGGLKDLKYTPRVVKHVCCTDNNAEHFPCLVNCYSTYLENIKFLAEKVDAFYFHPNRDPGVFSYQKAAMGINTLNKILPDMLCREAGLKRKTSHSLRVTCATRLFQESVPEKLIRERTGHRSNALFRYEKKSVEQERNVSDLLGPPRDVVDVVDVPDLDLNYEVRDEELCNMPMPSEVFDIEMSKSVFHNCTFNFATK